MIVLRWCFNAGGDTIPWQWSGQQGEVPVKSLYSEYWVKRCKEQSLRGLSKVKSKNRLYILVVYLLNVSQIYLTKWSLLIYCIDVYCVIEHFKICHNLKSNTLIFGVWGNWTLYSKSNLSLQSKGSVVNRLTIRSTWNCKTWFVELLTSFTFKKSINVSF